MKAGARSTTRRMAERALATLCLVCLCWAGVTYAQNQAGAGGKEVVVVAQIEGMIDLGQGPFVARVLDSATAAGASAVILDVNTFGGRVDAAVLIRDHLLRSKLLTVAFVNKRAISAGALISLAAEKVVMASGATIGAAMPVQMGQPNEGAKAVEEKTVSYLRKEFRATADARQRPGLIAEAMVDADVEIEGLIAKGKLLTLTTAEAIAHKVADFEADDLTQVLSKLGLAGAEVRHMDENWAERVVRFLTHPVLSSLLMTLAMLGIVIELRTPGFGLPGIVGLACLASFFWGHWLVHLVGWEEVLLVTAGIVLLLLEIFVVPGFGVTGVAGIAALLVGLTMSLFGAGAAAQTIVNAVSRVAISSVLAIGGSLAVFRLLPFLPGGRKLVLATALGGAQSTEQPERPSWLGAVGKSLSPLRPAGIADIAGQRVDVVSEGEFIDPGQDIEVVREEGNRVVVKRRAPSPTKGT
jgi:membrane-bound serine protease (ClpP class)